MTKAVMQYTVREAPYIQTMQSAEEEDWLTVR
jgi:hypothetical protein